MPDYTTEKPEGDIFRPDPSTSEAKPEEVTEVTPENTEEIGRIQAEMLARRAQSNLPDRYIQVLLAANMSALGKGQPLPANSEDLRTALEVRNAMALPAGFEQQNERMRLSKYA